MTRHFGPVQAEVDKDDQVITLKLKHARDPLPDGVIQNLKDWALSVCAADYPDFRVIDEVVLDGRQRDHL